jgi:hypothetical protein
MGRRLLPSGGGGVNAAAETSCLPQFALSHFDVQKEIHIRLYCLMLNYAKRLIYLLNVRSQS